MAGISSKAVLKAITPYKANGGSEFEEEGSLDYYNTFYRKYDVQIGRFTGVDMKAESFVGLTPYQFGNNNPVLYNDPLGDKFVNIKPADPMANTFAWALSYRSSLVDENPSIKIQSMWDNMISGGGGGGGCGVTAYKDMTSFSGDVAKAVFAALFCQNESDAVEIQFNFDDGGNIYDISSTFSANLTTYGGDLGSLNGNAEQSTASGLLITLRNNTGSIIWFKPEKNGDPIQPLKPGESTTTNIDGLTHPSRPNEIFKVITPMNYCCGVVANPWGVDIGGDLPFGSQIWNDINRAGNGGWKSYPFGGGYFDTLFEKAGVIIPIRK